MDVSANNTVTIGGGCSRQRTINVSTPTSALFGYLDMEDKDGDGTIDKVPWYSFSGEGYRRKMDLNDDHRITTQEAWESYFKMDSKYLREQNDPNYEQSEFGLGRFGNTFYVGEKTNSFNGKVVGMDEKDAKAVYDILFGFLFNRNVPFDAKKKEVGSIGPNTVSSILLYQIKDEPSGRGLDALALSLALGLNQTATNTTIKTLLSSNSTEQNISFLNELALAGAKMDGFMPEIKGLLSKDMSWKDKARIAVALAPTLNDDNKAFVSDVLLKAFPSYEKENEEFPSYMGEFSGPYCFFDYLEYYNNVKMVNRPLREDLRVQAEVFLEFCCAYSRFVIPALVEDMQKNEVVRNPWNEGWKETYSRPKFMSAALIGQIALFARKNNRTETIGHINDIALPGILKLLEWKNPRRGIDYGYVYIEYPMKVEILSSLMAIGNPQAISYIRDCRDMNYRSRYQGHKQYSLAAGKEKAIGYLEQQSGADSFIVPQALIHPWEQSMFFKSYYLDVVQ